MIFGLTLIAHAMLAAIPDPKALLAGVEAARLQIPPSHLVVIITYKTALHADTTKLAVDFDSDRRRLLEVERAEPMRVLFDGSRVAHFDGHDSVTLRSLGKADSAYLFEPRAIGITTTYSWRDTLEKLLPYRDAPTVETVGAEQIDGVNTWHVRSVDVFGQVQDIWIDPQHNFRVYRSDFTLSAGAHNSTRSYYDPRSDDPFPSRAVTINRAGKEHPVEDERTLTIESVQYGVRFDPATWTIAGLSPPIHASVTDLATKRRIGYWDGTQVRSSAVAIAVLSGSPAATHNASHRTLLIIAAAVLILVICSAIVLITRSRRVIH